MCTLLKLACANPHHALEQTTPMRHLMSPALTLQSYVALLRIWQRVWSALELALHANLPQQVPPHHLPPARAGLINLDLANIGAAGPSPKALAVLASAPCRFDAQGARWYGLAYLAQGAMLGGAVIASQLQRHLGLRPAQGAAFFSGNASHGPSTAATWRQWQQWLDAQDFSAADTALLISAAIDGFNNITQVFETCEPLLDQAAT